jgi:hypothetical protein
VLHGAAQAFLDRIGDPWQEPEEGYRKSSVAKIVAQFGEDQFEPAYAEGRTLGFDDAIDAALGDVHGA